MLSALLEFNSREKLFSNKNKLLLAVSGGLDSVAMCALLHEAKINFGIAHCNFGLRGKESDDDEKFVRALAKKHSVPVYVKLFNTNKYAEEKNISIQMAARELRYKWFEEIRRKNNYTSIVTAHHKGDVAETILINLIRGTGIRGLHGILPKQNKIIRPLLFATREDITNYAKKNKLSWREDSSNASDKYLRNNLRLNIIPQLKKINPSLEESLYNTSKKLKSAEDALTTIVEKEKKRLLQKQKNETVINIKQLQQLQPLNFYLFEFIKHWGFNEDATTNIIASLNRSEGKLFFSETHQIVKDREELIISNKNSSSKKIYSFKKDDKNIASPIHIRLQKLPAKPGFLIPKEKNIACFDYDKLSAKLSIRKWKNGDSFTPLGMKGEKKLSDYFIDNKFSFNEKENTWLLLSGKDIIWIIGHRINELYKITKSTKNILVCRL